VRFHPSTGAACRYWRPHLQLSNVAAYLAPYPDRQAALSSPATTTAAGRTENAQATRGE
jgi:hypothetical protein